MNDVLSEDVALKELNAIQEIFDVVYDNADLEKILPAIKAGRFIIDSEKETITYRLEKPIEQKNDEVRGEITFRAPTVGDIEKLNQGFAVKTTGAGESIIDLGALMSRTIKATRVLSGWPLGLMERISRKDMRVFSGLFNFFE